MIGCFFFCFFFSHVFIFVSAFVTQRNERSLKYETTRPVIAKPKSAKQARRNSTGSSTRKPPLQNRGKTIGQSQPQTDLFNTTVKRIEAGSPDRNIREMNTEEQNIDGRSIGHYKPVLDGATAQQQSPEASFLEDELDQSDSVKPAVSVRVKSAFTRRPGFIDEFSEDEKAMKDMEEDFKKTALSLQKRLGIDGNGVILF